MPINSISRIFSRIGIFAKPEGTAIKESVKNLVAFLENRNLESKNLENRKQHSIILETATAGLLGDVPENQIFPAETIGKHCDLIIVVGGDGSMLKASRAIVDYGIPIVGINRGTLGFMADITPESLSTQLASILDGNYIEDERCLLLVEILRHKKIIFSNTALNDAVLYNADMARLMEFEIYIDDQFVMHQRSDGIITATPTGSTAYALSAGGPIVYPTLHAFSLVPMYPHTLTSRPIVVQDTSVIRYLIPNKHNAQHHLACDGQIRITLESHDEIFIKKHKNTLKIIHPKDHSHFALLRNKLGWSTYAGSNRFQQTVS